MSQSNSSPTYTNPMFTYATSPSDQFQVTDLQSLAQAVLSHDHSTGNGKPISSTGIANGAVGSTQLASGLTLAGTTILSNVPPQLKLTDTTGGDTTPNKWIQVATNGHLQILNNTQGLIWDLADNGTVTNQSSLLLQYAGATFGLLDTTNGQATPNKYLRSLGGHFQAVNSAASGVILDLDDSGNVTTYGNLNLQTHTLQNATISSPTLNGTATGDATLPVRMLSMPFVDINPGGSITVNSSTPTTILTGSLTVSSPSNGLVLVTGRVALGSISNPSSVGLSVVAYVDGVEIGRIDHTPPLGTTDTFAITGLVTAANGAHTITFKAFWNATTGSPSCSSVNDARWTQGYAAQIS